MVHATTLYNTVIARLHGAYCSADQAAHVHVPVCKHIAQRDVCCIRPPGPWQCILPRCACMLTPPSVVATAAVLPGCAACRLVGKAAS
jgi:hypothetical protein